MSMLSICLGYALPHASKNIMKNKFEGVTEHWLCNAYIYIIKRLFYVNFQARNQEFFWAGKVSENNSTSINI